MSERTYKPKRGDLVHLNFSPSAGREMADWHYAVVVSSTNYNRVTGMAVVCVITSRIRGGPFEVPVPKGLLPPKAGVGMVDSVVVADAVRQVDYRDRSMRFINPAPREFVETVLDTLFAVLEED
jgi:mRNA-degrading endonuclease toxin of MazEF toxin-antitoxin module